MPGAIVDERLVLFSHRRAPIRIGERGASVGRQRRRRAGRGEAVPLHREPVWERVAVQKAREVPELWAARSAALGPVVRPAAAVKPELEADACCSGGRSAEYQRCRYRCRLV
jgi:hypothetical protein